MVLSQKKPWENSEGAKKKKTPAHNMPYQTPRILCIGICLGWELHAPPGRTLSQIKARWPARENSETHPITIRPETVSHVAEQVSLTTLFSIRARHSNEVFCFVSTCISSGSSFPSVRQEPGWGASPATRGEGNKQTWGYIHSHTLQRKYLDLPWPWQAKRDLSLHQGI